MHTNEVLNYVNYINLKNNKNAKEIQILKWFIDILNKTITLTYKNLLLFSLLFCIFACSKTSSSVKLKQDNISVFNNVRFSLLTVLSSRLKQFKYYN